MKSLLTARSLSVAVASLMIASLGTSIAFAEARPPAAGLLGPDRSDAQAAPGGSEDDVIVRKRGGNGAPLGQDQDTEDRPSGCIFRDRPLELIV